ncbi:hypothetical protein Acr_08g0006090 [Actinidia rufa]|uniref:Uncharacterized protein n=1 Tax=Actinidia rufa TaxID=165716 RepID=A0A7J0F0R8_9ERIC|nr:hypothetical protein Acr_08g0006090 [Actinidia rufa]
MLCAEGLGERECYGASESTESTERSDREWARIGSLNYWFLSVDVGIVGRTTQVRVAGESPECHRSKLSNSEQIRSAQNQRLSIPRDSSLRYEAPAPNGFQIGVQTSPHAPLEVRRVRSTRPTRARSRRRLEFTRHAPPRARKVTHAPARADSRVPSTRTRAHAPSRAPTRQESGCHSQHAQARARRVAATRRHAPHAPSQPSLTRRADMRVSRSQAAREQHARRARSAPIRAPQPIRAVDQITPCEKPRMKDTEGDEQEDDWADQTMHWTRVEGDVPGEDISEQSLIEKACVEASERDYSGGTNERVLESHRKRSKEEAREEVSRRRSQRRDKKNCPRNKAQDQSSEAATTAMMAVNESDVLLAASADEESDWISDSEIAYHLCRDREVFSTHVACEGLVRMANDAIVGKGQSASGGTLRVSKENRRSCKRRKTGRLYRLKENVQTGELLSDIGPVVLARWMDEEATVAQRHAKQAQEYLMDVLEGSIVEQERKEMLWDTCGSLARHEKCNQCRMSMKKLRGERQSRCTTTGATSPKRVSFARDQWR